MFKCNIIATEIKESYIFDVNSYKIMFKLNIIIKRVEQPYIFDTAQN